MPKRTLALLLLCLSLVITACNSGTNENTPSTSAESNNSQTTETNETDTTATPEEGSMDTHLEISWLSNGFQDALEDEYIGNRLGEQFNVKLVPRKINIQDTEQIDLMLASGEMPDFSILGKTPIDMYNQGVTRTIPKALIETYAPNYAKLLNSSPVGQKMHQLAGTEDEYMALTGYFEDAGLYYVSNYRLDWLENLGIKPNGNLKQLDEEGKIWFTDQPFTQAQLTDILQKFTNNDPDQNGQNDTFGLTGMSTNGYDNYSWGPLLGMFGIGYAGERNSNLEENGQTIHFSISQNYKSWLKFMAGLYTDGVLDPEFVTSDWARFHEKIAANKIGYWPNQYQYFNPLYIDRQPFMVLNNQPEAKILVTPPEIGDSGQKGTNRNWNFFRYTFYVGKDVSDEKLIRILQIFDYMNFDKEGRVWTVFGQEGIDFTWDGTPLESSAKIMNVGSGGVSKNVTPYNGGYITTKDHLVFNQDKLTKAFYDEAALRWNAEYGILPHRADPLNQTDLEKIFAEVGAGLHTLRMEFMFNVITGAIDVDKEWDNYVGNMNQAGMDRLAAELNKATLTTDLVQW